MRTRSGRATAVLPLVVLLMAAIPAPTSWAVSDGTWSQLAPSGVLPSPRAQPVVLYDSAHDRMIAFGGVVWGSDYMDVWALPLDAAPYWTQITPSGPTPGPRCDEAAIYDPVRDRMVIYGGFCRWCSGAYWYNDTWELSLGDTPQWTQLSPAGTPPGLRASCASIYDPVRDRMIIFGGELGVLADPAGHGGLNDVWALSLGASPQWTQLSPTGTPPSARWYSRPIYDPVRDRMVFFGGNNQDGVHNDVWALSLGAAPEWSQLNPSGPLPAERGGSSAIYDPVRDRLVLFGGGYGDYVTLNDVWALSLGAAPQWTQLAPFGTPPVDRFLHGAIYDAPRDRMLIAWGMEGYGGYRNDVWALDWSEATSATLQCPADMTVPAFSSISSVSLVGFRITNTTGSPSAFDYTVSAIGPAALVDKGNPLSLAGTTPVLAPGATYYPPEAGLVIPEIRDYSEVHVTYHVADATNSSCTSVIVMTPPVPTLVTAFDATAAAGSVRLSWDIFSDEEVSGFRVYRGPEGEATPHGAVSSGLIAKDARSFVDEGVRGGETYRYALGVVLADQSEVRSPIVTVKATALALALDQNVPNPFNPSTTISFTLPARARVMLSIYDVEGRLVRTLADESLGEGRHEYLWDGNNAAGSAASSGLYFYRLKVDNRALTKKMVLLK